jgi:DNA recombination protein RmuC
MVINWTTELIAVTAAASLVLAALGYLLATALQGRKAARLELALQQAQQEREAAVAQAQQQQAEVAQHAAAAHTQALAHSRLEALHAGSEAEQKRLQHERDEYKTELASVQQLLDKQRAQTHSADKQLEAAQADLRAQKAQVHELRERLTHSQQATQAERDAVNQLKQSLAQEGKNSEALEGTLSELRNHYAELKQRLTHTEQTLAELQARHQGLAQQHAQLQTEQEAQKNSHARELANFEKQKHSLTEQFKVLSNEILAANTKALQESSKLSLSAVINPFQQSIDNFKKEVQDIHHRESTQQGELRKELQSLKELNQQITAEAHELSTALKGQKKLQGNWGELVLENVLERSGLQLGKDYKREVSVTTEEGRQRPDAVVYLPQDKHLVIDAKVSLNAYTRFVNSTDELERKHAIKEHVTAVGNRIKELAERDYYRLPGFNSPEMVFMFIPIESAFVEALKADETLFQQAIENNVLVATPTTLLTSLNIVRQLWRYEDQNKHTAALASKAETVFKKLNSFLNSFEKIKKGLDNATEAYGKAEGQLVSGRGNLVKQVGEFKNLAPAIKAELPSYFTDKAALEIDFIPPEADAEETPPNKQPSQMPTPRTATQEANTPGQE